MFKIHSLGQRSFFCNGWISLGLFNSQILLTYLLIFLGPALFVFLEILFNDDSFALTKISISLLFLGSLTIIFFLINIFSDAGILKIPLTKPDNPNESSKLTQYKNETFARKYCQTCQIFRNFREHHCKICGLCVEGFDHHSHLTSNCIGKRNRRSFFLFLCFSISTVLEIFAISLFNLLNEKSQNDKPRVIYSLFFLILSSFLFFSLGMILLLQIYLISNGLNTVEYFRIEKENNPFDQGFWRNWWGFIKEGTLHSNINVHYLNAASIYKKSNESMEIALKSFSN